MHKTRGLLAGKISCNYFTAVILFNARIKDTSVLRMKDFGPNKSSPHIFTSKRGKPLYYKQTFLVPL